MNRVPSRSASTGNRKYIQWMGGWEGEGEGAIEEGMQGGTDLGTLT